MTAAIKRSPERLVFYYKTADTPMTVKRDTLRRAARKLGLDETGFLHLAAAQMLGKLNEKPAPPVVDDDERLTDQQIAKLRKSSPQNIKPTRSFIDLLAR